ncbi:hypothetical protein [uncultured Brevundimonas sp.]|uniref:hypothetical protein n=1 Tax=uncultured Brevundimonas sp. TaxID=213418 RepID=UPI0025F85275|nr:hypothetical protein [uncultured Brevundimonas sp.]
MNRIAFVAVSAAALMIAGAASAQTARSETVAINASVAPKCGVSAQTSTVTLGSELTDANAKVRSAVTTEIANALNGANIIAFCNGVNNKVEVKRAVLARTGSTGSGLTQGDFAQFIRYNLDASLNNVFLDSTSTDGSSTVASRFGGHDSPNEPNTRVRFTQAASDGAAVASSNGSSPTATNWSSLTDRRLAAGTYTGSVELIVTPGT